MKKPENSMKGGICVARRRDVVLAEVFFSDAPDAKTRPCIVLSNETYNAEGYSVVALITTGIDGHCMPISENDAGCKFYHDSGVRFDAMMRVENEKIGRKIGRTTPEFYNTLVERMIETVRG